MHHVTKINIKPSVDRISYSDRIMSFGSCFSVDIMERLKRLQYAVLSNPAGITFNPSSIYHTIKSMITADSLPEHSLQLNGDIWSHPNFHSSFNSTQARITLEKINGSLQSARQFAQELDWVVITLGTAFVYQKKSDGSIVNNCHKFPTELFQKKLLSVEEIEHTLQGSIDLLNAIGERKKKFIFTVSPIRHIKEGLHENNISKASCLLAINNIVKGNSDCCQYFPSYEILLDELRDYRYYGEDLIHPSALALHHIFSLFSSNYLDDADQDLRKSIQSINMALEHRALHPDSEQHKIFMEQTIRKAKSLQEKYDFIDFGV